MTSLINGLTFPLKTLFRRFQIKHILSVILIGCILMINTACASPSSATVNPLKQKVDAAIEKNDSPRPKTTGEWKHEARETKNAPGERLQKIAKESKEAVKEFSKVYPNTAERSANSLNKNADQPK
jgi:hypothetical protein